MCFSPGASPPCLLPDRVHQQPAADSCSALTTLHCTSSYTCLYLNRGTLTYSAPVMVQDISLGLSKTDIGAMTSAFPAAYGVWWWWWLEARTHTSLPCPLKDSG